ncbi:hypothetical protein D3C81_2044420 [compost metagenome]
MIEYLFYLCHKLLDSRNGLSRLIGQLLHLSRYHLKPSALLTRSGSFNRCIQGQQMGL